VVNAPASIPEIGDVFACGARARRAMVKWTARGNSARRIGLVHYPRIPVDCSGVISTVVNIPAAGFSIPRIGDIFACGAPTRSHMAKRMVRGDLACRAGLVRYPQSLVDNSGVISMLLNTSVEFRNAKMRDVFACGATVRRAMAKRMA